MIVHNQLSHALLDIIDNNPNIDSNGDIGRILEWGSNTVSPAEVTPEFVDRVRNTFSREELERIRDGYESRAEILQEGNLVTVSRANHIQEILNQWD